MPATLRHFAINADDVQRARRFYETLFGWEFTPFGPPNFYQIKNAGTGFYGALQERRELVAGYRTVTFENSFGVPDLRSAMAQAEAGGGAVLTRPYRIEGVGDLVYVQDPEGNALGVMQYDKGIWD